MVEQKHNSAHWITGAVLLLTGALIIGAVTLSFSHAQLSNTGNLPANVPIADTAPTFSGHQAWQQPQGGSISSFTHTGVGDTISGVVGGYTTVFVNVNVEDKNSYSDSNVNVSARLIMTYNDGTGVNRDGDAFLYDPGYGRTLDVCPTDGGVPCTNVQYISDTEWTWHCAVNIYYMSYPTAPGTSIRDGVDAVNEHWRMVFAANDDSNTTQDYDSVHFEYPNILGLKTEDSINFGTVARDGTPSGIAQNWLQNKGNQSIDIAVETDKQTDADAWSCTGGGNPLVSDIHLNDDSQSSNYDTMRVLNLNLAGSGDLHEALDLNPQAFVTEGYGTSIQFRFATTEVIGPGICTLSNIVFTAVKGY